MGGGADHYRIGFRLRLHPCGDVWGLTEGERLFAASRPNHYCAGMDSDPHLHQRALLPRIGVQARDRIDDRDSGARRPFGVVVVRLGPTEVRHHSIAQKLGNMAAEARNHLCCRAMIIRREFAPFLRIKPRRNLGRAYQVAEQNR